MLRSEIESEIGRLLADPSNDRWSVDVIRERIEFAQAEVQALTGAVKTVETLTPTVDTAEVTLNNQILDIVRATLTDSGGTIHVLEGRSRDDLDFYIPNWVNAGSGQPVNFYFDPSTYQLVLYPKPSDSFAQTDGLKVWEVKIPAELASSTDEPFDGNTLMRAYTMSVVHWVVAQCWMDDATPESLSKSKFHKTNNMDNPGEYEKVIKKINAKFNSPSIIPARIKWQPQGGRSGSGQWPTKSNPLGL